MNDSYNYKPNLAKKGYTGSLAEEIEKETSAVFDFCIGLSSERRAANKQNRKKMFIEQDRLNRQTPFEPQKQLYPADLFVLVDFDYKGRPIKERNPRWHDKDGFYIGRPTR